MRIVAADQVKYPHFFWYVKTQFPKLAYVPLVVKNAKLYGHLSHDELKKALAWGTKPTIVITDLHSGQCGVPKAYGCFRHAKPGNVEIHEGVVKEFENASSNRTDKSVKGKHVYVAGATLLHELCHWGNYNNVPRVPELKEMGEAFEKATYGKILY